MRNRDPVRAQQQNLAVLLRFIKSLPMLLRCLPLILIVIVAASSAPQFFLWYVGEFINCHQTKCGGQTTWAGHHLPLSLTLLSVVVVSAMFLRILAWALFEILGVVATLGLHDQMIHSLRRVRTTYFDETPSGHLINRIIGDFGSLRFMGVIRIGDAINALVEVGAVAVLVALVHPWPALAVIPALLAFFHVQLSIGPMLGHVEEIASHRRGELVHRETDLIDGRRVFALFDKEADLFERIARTARRQVEARVLAGRIQAWSQVWMRVIAATYGFVVIVFVHAGVSSGHLSYSLAAVVLSSLFALSGSMSWLTFCITMLTESLGNARRVFELVDLPREETLELAKEVCPARSPLRSSQVLREAARGDLQFHAASVCYRPELPPVLKDLDLTLPAGCRIGLVGRTGSGKTSVTQALLRMVHVLGGDITASGVSIYSFDLEAWRAQFGIVPQHPYLFEGTLRSNLDREGRYADSALMDCLRQVDLGFTLDHKIIEAGKNLSLGERQLVCLARVLLGDKAVIILDEPTSSIDSVTDQKIQRVLSTALKGRTILTVAHRLETLRDYDLILELSEGRVKRSSPL